MNWEQFVNRLQATSAGMSLSLNFLLIVLIIKRSPEQMGSYRYLMIYTALFEMFYSIVDVVASPTIYSHEVMFLVIVPTKDSMFSKFATLLLLCLWCACFGSFMTLFCIQFAYRYFVVIGSKSLKTFNDLRIVFWIMIPIVSGTVWGIFTYFFMAPKMYSDLPELLLNELDFNVEDINFIGSRCYHKKANGESEIDIDSLIAISFMMTVMTSSLSCLIVLAIKTFLRIRSTLNVSSMSNKHNRLQSQTFYSLVTQTLIPVILMHLPCIMIMSTAMMDIDLGHSSGIVSVTFALFPALDPLPVMLIIKNYRGTLWHVMSTSVNIFVRRQVTSE